MDSEKETFKHFCVDLACAKLCHIILSILWHHASSNQSARSLLGNPFIDMFWDLSSILAASHRHFPKDRHNKCGSHE